MTNDVYFLEYARATQTKFVENSPSIIIYCELYKLIL